MTLDSPASTEMDKIASTTVRQALRAWHNAPSLGKGTLAQLRLVEARRQKAGYPDTLEDRGRALREVLRDAINIFPHQEEAPYAPGEDIAYPDKTYRPYVILRERFVNGRAPDYVAAQLGIARRTYYEEQSAALATLADILRQREAALLAQSVEADQAAPTPVKPALPSLAEAREQLNTLPLDVIPIPGPLPSISRMPLSRNPLFVGRDVDLKQLAVVLKGGETIAIGQLETAAATGLGGIGKTQLASEFVHRYGQFFTGGVFWLSFADPKAIPAEIAACGGTGHLALRPNFSELSLEDQVDLVQAAWREPIPRLLVFDNCEEPDLLTSWRPTSGGCRILVTSRRSRWEPALGIQALSLDVLERSESLTLLRQHRPDGDEQALNAIAEELGDLPLALHLAGSYLARYQRVISPEQYLVQLRDPALLKHPSLKGPGVSPTGHIQNVYRTIALSYDQLDPADPADQLALKVLTRAACLAPGEPIPFHLLICLLGLQGNDLDCVLQATDGIDRLVASGLIKSEADGAIRLHRLVVAFVQDGFETKIKSVQRGVEVAVYKEARRLNVQENPAPVLAWQPHLRFITDRIMKCYDAQSAKLCNELGQHLLQISDYTGAQPYLAEALAIRQTLFGEEHPDTAETLNNLGYLLRSQGRLDEAKVYFERALTIREKTLGEEHLDTAESLNEMGRWWYMQRDLAQAQLYLTRALEISRKLLGEKHKLTADFLNNLGMTLYSLKDNVPAHQCLEQALDIRREILGQDHPLTALSFNNLGYLLKDLGRLNEAQVYYEEALAIRLKVLGEDHRDTAQSLNNMGALLHAQGNLDAANLYLERALKVYEKTLGKDHLSTAFCLNNLGLLAQNQEKLDRARRYLERALTIRQSALREDHPLKALSLHNFGVLLQAQNHFDDARPYLEQALAIRQSIFGKNHPLTVESLKALGYPLEARME